jgi:RNA polymerase sigma-70 factor (ECF subfamily)
MDTPVGLLLRLRQPGEQEGWRRFVRLYTPLLYRWARCVGLQGQDADDLVQDVLLTLVRALPAFAYNPEKSFRGWLRTILMNRWRADRRRPQVAPARDAPLADLPDPCGVAPFWEVEYRQQLAGRALRLIQREFQPTTWKAFWEYAVQDRPADDVAAELGVRVDVIYSAKCRVLRRLREELHGLLD